MEEQTDLRMVALSLIYFHEGEVRYSRSDIYLQSFH